MDTILAVAEEPYHLDFGVGASELRKAEMRFGQAAEGENMCGSGLSFFHDLNVGARAPTS